MQTRSKMSSLVLNVYKPVEIKNSPFNTIVYILNNGDTFLVENPRIGKTAVADIYTMRKLFHITEVKTDWMRTFNGQYIKFEKDSIYHFLPLFYEQFRYPILTFEIFNQNAPLFRTTYKNIDNHRFKCIDNEISEDTNKTKGTTYNYLFQNLKPFQTNNFQLELIENPQRNLYYEDGIRLLPDIRITCRVPIFQLYAILCPSGSYDYRCNLLIMKINNTFYRFPYGNIYQNDQMCFGINSMQQMEEEPPSIGDVCYSHIITSNFNGDFSPMINFDNTIPISLDIDQIREKISKDDFSISFIDSLLYLSSCQDPKDINLKLFLQSPNVPMFKKDEEN